MKLVDSVKHDLKTDVNWNRAGWLAAQGARALPSASVQYVLDKVPIVGWAPRYNYRWLLNDLIAGLTLGLMLIPQSLSYAKIATIPVQYGLMSSWFPGTLYAFMGTTKDLSTGPTSLIGLLTSEAVEAIPEYTPQQVASAIALLMGVYGMILGFLKLGFLLEFISLPILSGFISAVAITIILNQVDSLLGEDNVGDGVANQIHDILTNLGTCNGYACGIGFGGIVFLVILEQAGKRWGTKNKFIWFLSITRAFLALVLFTGISYAVNKKYGDDDDSYLFEVVKVKANGIEHPKMPDGTLIGKVASRSIAVFIAAAVEHTAIARAFGVRNDYTSDQSQELCYFGVCNFFNSFFHVMGVGGAMSRTAVNSSCKVKSPLSGIVTTAVVLVSIYKLVGALYWIPKATLAAIIITAVWPLISSPATFYKYWKTSLADFISCMIAFWVSLFVSTEYGIASSVGFNILYCILRQVFTKISSIGADSRSELASSIDSVRGMPSSIPSDVRIFRFNDSFFFPNAYSLKTAILDTVQTHHAPDYASHHAAEADRNWSVTGEKRIARLRKRAHVEDPSMLPPIRLIVLDFGRVNHIDATAITHMRTLFNEVQKYAGKGCEIRFTGMTNYVRARFRRGGWIIIDPTGPQIDGDEGERHLGHAHHASIAGLAAASLSGQSEKEVTLFRNVAQAVMAPKRQPSGEFEEVQKAGDESVIKVSHNEKV